jgi:hypothetical protein
MERRATGHKGDAGGLEPDRRQQRGRNPVILIQGRVAVEAVRRPG